ncbi:helix-turn-helix domain-containing protein [Brachybacterium sp. FME24]|uniref:winged helix-turn-helix transcriptional regulator n=1 Tax=Brachybacterium sp. FME24 TaxID=2742605 RepID=UPI001868B013|nr:helix-turn-helix domain-containing protein [Brachybacterium sp. FME24]
MSIRRSYGSYNDGYASAHALDLLGERWTLIVVRELLLGPKRFADLQRDVLGISPGVLSRRLQELESRGIAVRRTLPAPARVDVYELTPWGSRLEAVNTALSRWAVDSPQLPWEADMSPDTLVLAMRAHARPVASATVPITVALSLLDSRLEESEPVVYAARISAEGTTIVRDPANPAPGPADARVAATTADWKACILAGVAPGDLSELEMAGSDAAVDALLEGTALTH